MALVDEDEVIDLADGVYEAEPQAVAMLTMGAVVASAIPMKPPRDWFTDPKLDSVTPLVVQSDGRVFGHIAGWKQDHIGMSGKIRAPRSRSDYAFFATGLLECDDGSEVNVGQITLVGGHAPLEASVAEAVAHYDNTDSAVMDVAVGEDKHGIWVAGALHPDVDELKLRRLRASGVSGDWRPINGHLELVAVCSVNVPGFPIPRARVAAGQPVALVAAGMTEIAEAVLAGHATDEHRGAVTAALGSVDERLRLVEDALLGRVLERRDALIAAIGEAREVAALEAIPTAESVDDLPSDSGIPSAESLRTRVHGTVAAADPAAALRARVHGSPGEGYEEPWPEDGLPFEISEVEIVQAALRSRVQGTLVGRATSEWDAAKRKTASNRGTAMKDGSYPISDLEDLRKAMQAFGRAKDKAATKRHLLKRAKALKASQEIIDRISGYSA